MNIYLEDITEDELDVLHELILELHGRTGKYVNELIEVEDRQWWYEHDMDKTP